LPTDPLVRRRSAKARLASVTVVAVVLGCFALALRAQWRVIAGTSWRLDPAALALATLALAASFAVVALLWAVALRQTTGVGLRRGVRIWFLSNLARYVPGNVWSYVGAVELARREGAGRRATLTVMALTQLLSVGVALLVGLPVLAAEQARLGRPALAGLAVLAALVLAAVLARRPLGRLLARRYPEVRPRDLVPPAGLALRLTLGYALYWLVAGLAFGLFAASVYPPAAGHLPLAVAGFAAAYAAGFLALLTPSGLGVREGVLVLVLAPVMPVGVATVVAVGARLWMMLVELGGAAVAHALGGPSAAPGER
jgi:hypothetical protein